MSQFIFCNNIISSINIAWLLLYTHWKYILQNNTNSLEKYTVVEKIMSIIFTERNPVQYLFPRMLQAAEELLKNDYLRWRTSAITLLLPTMHIFRTTFMLECLPTWKFSAHAASKATELVLFSRARQVFRVPTRVGVQTNVYSYTSMRMHTHTRHMLTHTHA